MIALSKIEIIKDKSKDVQKIIEIETGKKPILFSSFSKEGLNELIAMLFKECNKNNDK